MGKTRVLVKVQPDGKFVVKELLHITSAR